MALGIVLVHGANPGGRTDPRVRTMQSSVPNEHLTGSCGGQAMPGDVA